MHSKHFSVSLISIIGLLLGTTASAQVWQTEGPQPLTGGQSEALNESQVGAVNAIAAHPTDADIIYIGAVNGGVWKTINGTNDNPTWLPTSDDQQSLSIYDLNFDPTDATNNTLVAGVGTTSSLGSIGGDRTGIMRTTDGGDTWVTLDGGLAGSNISGVAPRGDIIVVTADNNDVAFDCASVGVFRSTDTGQTFTQVTNGIGAGSIDALTSDPNDNAVMYASLVANGCPGSIGGIYRTANSGTSWTKVSDAAVDALLGGGLGTHVEMTVGSTNNVYVAIAPAGALGGLFRSANGLGGYVALDLPTTTEVNTTGPDIVGLHPGGQAGIHMSIAADPNNANVVYIGGDRQPGANGDGANGAPFPNSVGATTFSGRSFRLDASLPGGSQFTPLTHVGTASNSSTHADSRDMMFDAAGNLLQSDDGGIYRRTSPQDATGDWSSIVGTLRSSEVHSSDYDLNADILGGGLQDNSQGNQSATGSLGWNVRLSGDGGDYDVDNQTLAGSNQAVRYTSAQTLLGFVRDVINDDNTIASTVFPALTPVGGAPACTGQFVNSISINSQDGTRLVFGCGNGIYESFDQGDTVNLIAGPAGVTVNGFGFGFDTIAAGAPGNPELLYVADGSSPAGSGEAEGVFRRLAAGAPLELVFSTPDQTVVSNVIQDDQDGTQAFFSDLLDGIFRTTDTGDTWNSVNGNLFTDFDPGRIWSIAHASNPLGGDDALIAGTDRGVFIASEATGFTVWRALGVGFPNAQVFTLRYEADLDQLFASTLGRGTFSLGDIFAPVLGEVFFIDGFESTN